MSGLTDVTLVGAGGEYMDAAVLIEWTVQPGGKVQEGDVVAIVETAKAATEIVAPASGTIVELLAKPGEEIKVGAVLARIGSGAASASGAAAPAAAPAAQPAQVRPPVDDGKGLVRRLPNVFASPLAKRIARDRGLDLSAIRGTGPNGRIMRADVERAASAASAAAAAAAAASTVPASVPAQQPAPEVALRPQGAGASEGYRRAMASHMVKSAAIPAFTVGMDIDGAALLAARAEIKRQGGRATINDLIIQAVARALREHPRVNAHWDGEGVLFSADINIGVAVATDLGLVVPVVHRADTLDAEGIAERMATLRVKAQSQRLSLAEISGGTFSISNLGSFGVTAFTAALNPPAAAILAVPAFRPVTLFENGKLETRQLAHFSVTADHRVLDGADVARFLNTLKEIIERGMPR